MRLPAAAVALALPSLLVYLGLTRGAPLLMPLVGSLIGAVVLLAVARDRLTSECVALHADRVEVFYAHRFNASPRRAIVLGNVREVVVLRDRQGRPRLCVEGETTILEVGQALLAASLAWLRELVARHVAKRGPTERPVGICHDTITRTMTQNAASISYSRASLASLFTPGFHSPR